MPVSMKIVYYVSVLSICVLKWVYDFIIVSMIFFFREFEEEFYLSKTSNYRELELHDYKGRKIIINCFSLLKCSFYISL